MQDSFEPSQWPLWLSIVASVLLTLGGLLRIATWVPRMPASHTNTRTARRFVAAYVCAGVAWLGYAVWKGYARFLQADSARQLLLHSDALWSLPLFIAAIVWGAGWGVMWVLRSLEREALQAQPTHKHTP